MPPLQILTSIRSASEVQVLLPLFAACWYICRCKCCRAQQPSAMLAVIDALGAAPSCLLLQSLPSHTCSSCWPPSRLHCTCLVASALGAVLPCSLLASAVTMCRAMAHQTSFTKMSG